jgi:hypothetical protein
MGKVTSRTALTTIADGDLLHVVDISDTTDSPQGTSKKSTLRVIRKAMGDIYEAELSIATAAVLTLNATPLDIVAAPGAGYAIEVISATYGATYNSVAYATNTQLQLIASGATISQFLLSSALTFTASGKWKLYQYSSAFGATSTQVIENTALQVKVSTGNPTAGNSDIKVYVLYRIITV